MPSSPFVVVVRSLASAICLLSLPLVAGCTAPHEAETAGDVADFSVSNVSPQRSILPDIENTGGAPPVCIGLIGFEASARAATAARVEALVTDAAGKWNALLRGNPLWSLQREDLAPAFRVQDAECPRGGPGFNVNVWGTAEGFIADYCARPNYTCSSGAIREYRTLYLGPWNRTRAEDALDPFTMLHEYGHLLGLGDTYRIPGGNDWEGEQPASVMNGVSRTLTEDDKLGLWVTLRTLKTGVRSCEGFGEQVVMTANRWDSVLCSPSAQPDDNHGQPKPAIPIVLPNAGRWAYQGFDVTQTGMLVSDVAPAANGFVMSVRGYSNGQPPDGSMAVYRCDAAGACAADGDRTFRILIGSATTLRLITPAIPAGTQADFVGP